MMNGVGRLALLALAGIAALAVSGTALAAYTSPRLEIAMPSERLGGGGPLTIKVSQTRADDATGRLVIYVPQGYVSSLVGQVDQVIGSVVATAQGNAISPDTILPLTGRIINRDPTPYKSNPQSVGCNGNAEFDTVWELELTTAGQTLRVPMYVTTVTQPPEANFASGKLITCLPSPYIPPAQGGAQFGAKLLTANLTLRGIFTNPSTRGRYVWRSIWTPYAVGTGTMNPAGTVEAQAEEILSDQLTTRATYDRATKRVFLRGQLREGSAGLANAVVQLWMGRTARGVKRVKNVRTNRLGNYVGTINIARAGTYFFRARVVMPPRARAGCTTPTNPAIPCIRTVRSGFTLFNNRVVRIRVR